MVLHKDILETKQKFFDMARQAYPDVGEPGAVWVLTEVLGWDYEMVTKIPVEGFSPAGYKVFILDKDGKRIIDKDGTGFRAVSRKWTVEEKRKLKDWWWLLGF